MDWSTAVPPVFNGRRLITFLIIDLPNISYLATFFQINLFYIRFGCKKKKELEFDILNEKKGSFQFSFSTFFFFFFLFGSIFYINKKTFTCTHIFILKTWYEYITCKNSEKNQSKYGSDK